MDKVLGWIVSGTLTGVLLAGCGGNPAKRESNPVKNYTVKEGAQPLKPGTRNEKPVEPDLSQRICALALPVRVVGQDDSTFVRFVEGQPATYKIEVVSYYGESFDVKVSHPRDIEVRRIGKNKNVMTFQLQWTPPAIRAREANTPISAVTFTYQNPAITEKCGAGFTLQQDVKLLVDRAGGDAAIIVRDIPASPVKVGESFDFQIEIQDRLSTADAPPVIDHIYLNPSAAVNGERVVIDGSKAVTCERRSGRLQEDAGRAAWRFACKFDSSSLAADNAALNANGTIAYATFSIIAKRTVDGKVFGGETQAVRVQFPKISPSAATGAPL